MKQLLQILIEKNLKKILLFFALWYFFKGILSLSPISFLFGARFLEYIVVIAAAYNMNTKDLEKFFSIFTNFLIFYFFLEAIFILLGLGSPFSFLNSGMTWQGRFTSIFGGPYELGAIALLLTFLPGNQRKVFFIILLFFSQARASILGLGALIFNPRAWILILPLSIIMIFVAVSRFDDLFNLLPQISSIFETFTYLLNDFSYTSKEGYINNWNMREDVISLISEDGGRSTLLRIYTYLLILSGMSDISVIIF